MNFFIQKVFNKYVSRPVLKRKLKDVGLNFRFGFMSEINNPQFFTIGDNFYSGPLCLFSTNKNNPVEIGNNVMFGPRCNIQGGNHDASYVGFMRFNNNIEHMKSVISIENGVWIGVNTTIISGAKIQEGSIIGAMSLVNKLIPPYVISAGIPARVLKSRFKTIKQLSLALKVTGSKYTVEEILKIHKKYGITYPK